MSSASSGDFMRGNTLLCFNIIIIHILNIYILHKWVSVGLKIVYPPQLIADIWPSALPFTEKPLICNRLLAPDNRYATGTPKEMPVTPYTIFGCHLSILPDKVKNTAKFFR